MQINKSPPHWVAADLLDMLSMDDDQSHALGGARHPLPFVCEDARMEVPEWIKVEVSRNEKPLGTITFRNGELDLADIHPAPERGSLSRVFAQYEGKPFTYAWVGRAESTPTQYKPDTVRWFEAILFLVLGPEGYRYKELEGSTRPPRDTP